MRKIYLKNGPLIGRKATISDDLPPYRQHAITREGDKSTFVYLNALGKMEIINGEEYNIYLFKEEIKED